MNAQAEKAENAEARFNLTEEVDAEIMPVLHKLYEFCNKHRLPLMSAVMSAMRSDAGKVSGRMNLTEEIKHRINYDLILLAHEVQQGNTSISVLSSLLGDHLSGKWPYDGKPEEFSISEGLEKEATEIVNEIDALCYKWNIPYFVCIGIGNSEDDGYTAIRRAYAPEYAESRFIYICKICTGGIEQAAVYMVSQLEHLIDLVVSDEHISVRRLMSGIMSRAEIAHVSMEQGGE